MGLLKLKRFIDIPIYFKILWIMLFSTVIIISVIVLTQVLVLNKSFSVLEDQFSRKNLERAENTLTREIEYLSQLNQDWSIWDDTYNFAINGNQEYIESNLQDDTYYSIGINLFYIFDVDQNILWSKYIDLENEESIISDEFTNEILFDNSLMLTKSELNQFTMENLTRRGYWIGKEGIFLISTGPIYRSDHSGPPTGVLLMGKEITANFLENIRHITQNDFILETINSDVINEQIGETINNDYVTASKILKDIKGDQSILLKTYTERSITRFGSRSLSTFRFIIIFLFLIVTLILIVIFQKAVSQPIYDLIKFLGETQTEKKNSNNPPFREER